MEMFHDHTRHWNSETTREFIVDLFYCRSLGADDYAILRSLIVQQNAKSIPNYHPISLFPFSGLVGRFSVNFARSRPIGPSGEKHLFIELEHLIGSTVVGVATRGPSKAILSSWHDNIILIFGLAI